MSRKSAASLSVVPAGAIPRLAPCEDLTEDEAVLWVKTVKTKPAEWFDEDTSPTLFAYCKAVSAHRRISRQIDQLDDAEFDVRIFKTHAEVQVKQATLIAVLATKLRLTQQSRYTPKAASTASKKAGPSGKPWEKTA